MSGAQTTGSVGAPLPLRAAPEVAPPPRGMPAWVCLRDAPSRYAVAVLSSGGALAVTGLLGRHISRTPFAFAYVAVATSAAYGGLGPGLLASTIAFVATNYLFVEPVHSLHLTSAVDGAPVAAFVVVSWMISRITESLRERSVAADTRAGQVERERAHVRALLTSAGDGIYAIDPDGRCTSLNPAAAALLGFAEDELLGENMHERIHFRRPDGSPSPVSDCPIVRTSARGETVRVADDVFWRKDGSPLPVAYTSAPMIEAGRVTGTVVTFADMTARRRTERLQRFLADSGAVLAASLDFDTTLQSLAALAVPALADTCIIYMADGDGLRFVTVADVEPERANLVREFRQHHPIDPRGRHPAMRVLRSGEPVYLPDLDAGAPEGWADDAVHLNVIREVKPVAALWLPLAARGRVLGVLTLSMTARRYDETTLALAREMASRAAIAIDHAVLYSDAQTASRARDDVLAIVSHDLRNPIHTISMAASFLADVEPEPGTPAFLSQLAVIRRSAARANRLIGDLLDVTRIEAGRMAVERQTESPARIVAEAVEAQQAEALARSIRLSSAATDDLPPVWADRERILQLLGNLLANAIKFTPAGGRVSVTAAAAQGGVRFSVADTGAGIPSGDQPHLFDRYWQASRTDRRGVGLGLSIAKGIADAHGSRLAVDSAPGIGSTFSFTLPIAPPRPTEVPADVTAGTRPSASGGASRPIEHSIGD